MLFTPYEELNPPSRSATMLLFPDLSTLQLALTAGIVPVEVAMRPVEAAPGPDGALWVQPSRSLPRAVMAELTRLGVRSERKAAGQDLDFEPLTCWPQLIPARRDPAGGVPGPSTPVYFALPAAGVAGLVGEVLRLGNDRQALRWLDDGAGGPARALVRVIGPPYYALLRAIDPEPGDDDAPRAFVERAPRTLVEVGYTHPLLDRLRPPPGQLLMIGAERRWELLAEAPFRDVYEITDFSLPAGPVAWRDVEPTRRLTAPLRLARGGPAEGAELWVIDDRPEEQMEALVRRADDRLLARLAFAVGEDGAGRRVVVLRLRPSKLPPPVLVLEAVGYRPYLRLPNLFLPVGNRLNPPLRRDAVARRLAPDPAVITWLAPQGDGSFAPESLPDEAFRPLEGWVDYVLDREHAALEAWVDAARFDFEPFVCDEDLDEPAPRPTGRERTRKGERTASQAAEVTPPEPVPASRIKVRKAPVPDPIEPLPVVEPGAALRRLGELEGQFLALESPLDDPGRRPLWREMAGLNAALERAADATACWANALWEGDEPPPAWVREWAAAEAATVGKAASAPAALERLIGAAKPSAVELRWLATVLLRAAFGDGDASRSPLPARLGQVQHLLEQHEGALPVRVAWLAWFALARLSGGDPLMLARARDRALERLHQHGLSRELDLPSFLRFAGGASGERVRAVRDHMVRLHGAAVEWVARGSWGGPYTRGITHLIFAFGLARLGEAGESGRLQRAGLNALQQRKDLVAAWLARAYDARILQALEGKPTAGPLPGDLMEQLEPMGNVGEEARRSGEKIARYKIDRLREHSRILEPHTKIDPYRHWHGHRNDEVDRELAELVDLTDRPKLTDRIGRLLARPPQGPKADLQEARILRTALDVAYRLGESFALPLFGRVVPALDRLDVPRLQAELLERAIYLAAHFDQAGHVRAYVVRFDALLKMADASVPALEPLLGQCFRGLRKLGMRDEVARLLDRMAERILGGRSLSPAAAAALTGREAVERSKSLRLLLHVAAGWFDFGQADRARAVLDEARALLLAGALTPAEQTSLACGYVRALGRAPVALAVPRLDELFARLERVHDTLTTNSHYSLARLDLIEAVVLTLVSDDFTLDESGRSWLEDDEYLVRRRIHRDVRAALGQEP